MSVNAKYMYYPKFWINTCRAATKSMFRTPATRTCSTATYIHVHAQFYKYSKL